MYLLFPIMFLVLLQHVLFGIRAHVQIHVDCVCCPVFVCYICIFWLLFLFCLSCSSGLACIVSDQDMVIQVCRWVWLFGNSVVWYCASWLRNVYNLIWQALWWYDIVRLTQWRQFTCGVLCWASTWRTTKKLSLTSTRPRAQNLIEGICVCNYEILHFVNK